MIPHVLCVCVYTARYVTAPCENNEFLEYDVRQDDALTFYSSENNEYLTFSHAVLKRYRLNKGNYSVSFSQHDLSIISDISWIT